MSHTRTIITVMALAIGLPTAGCYAYDEGPGGSVGAGVYSPDVYDGNTVYFDNNEPYYYSGDQVVYVPHDRPEYGRFTEHHRRYPDGYSKWYATHPPARAFHRPAGHVEQRTEHTEHAEHDRR